MTTRTVVVNDLHKYMPFNQSGLVEIKGANRGPIPCSVCEAAQKADIELVAIRTDNPRHQVVFFDYGLVPDETGIAVTYLLVPKPI